MGTNVNCSITVHLMLLCSVIAYSWEYYCLDSLAWPSQFIYWWGPLILIEPLSKYHIGQHNNNTC